MRAVELVKSMRSTLHEIKKLSGVIDQQVSDIHMTSNGEFYVKFLDSDDNFSSCSLHGLSEKVRAYADNCTKSKLIEGLYVSGIVNPNLFIRLLDEHSDLVKAYLNSKGA